jgi:hypothetical protein
MPKRHVARVILAKIGTRCGKLVANALNGVFVGHSGRYFTVAVKPILDMMLISALVVKPRKAFSRSSAAYANRRTVAVKIFYRLKKLARRKFRQVVHEPTEGNAAFYAIYKNSVAVLRNYAEMAEKLFDKHKRIPRNQNNLFSLDIIYLVFRFVNNL